MIPHLSSGRKVRGRRKLPLRSVSKTLSIAHRNERSHCSKRENEQKVEKQRVAGKSGASEAKNLRLSRTVLDSEAAPRASETIGDPERPSIANRKRRFSEKIYFQCDNGPESNITESARANSLSCSENANSNYPSAPTNSSNPNSPSRHAETIEKVLEAFNSKKEELEKEQEMKTAFQELSESRGEIIARLKTEKRDLENHVEFLKTVNQREGLSKGSKRNGDARKRRRRSKDKDAELTKLQMPLWVFATRNLKNLAFQHVFCITSVSKKSQKRSWELELVLFPSSKCAEHPSSLDASRVMSEDEQDDFGSWICTTVNGRKAIPECSMAIAAKGLFYPAPLSQQHLHRQFLKHYRANPELQNHYPSHDEFEHVAKSISKLKLVAYKDMVNSKHSGRERDAVDYLLRKLGYPVLNQISKKEENYGSMRTQAELKISENIDTLLQTEMGKDRELRPVFETCRSSAFHQIAMDPSKEEPECPDAAEHSSSMRDILFSNNVAKQSCLIWTSCGVWDTCSVLELARLDAWIFAFLEIMKERILSNTIRQKGGQRNKDFNDRFKKCLPQALERTLTICRRELDRVGHRS